MPKYSLKKGMTTFVGCTVGEQRLSLLPRTFDADKDIQSLVKQGLLSTTIEEGRIWLALTAKGNRYIISREKYWS